MTGRRDRWERRRVRRSIGAAIMLCALASCTGPRPVATATPSPAGPVVAVAPTTTTTSSQVTPMGTFAFSGQLTQGGWIRGVVPKGTQALRLGAANLPFASDGRFFAAFDRDAGPQEQLTAVLASGLQVSLPLTIAPRAWDIERVNVGKRPGEAPSAEYERRRAPELARINAARALSSDSQGWRQAFVWPVIGRISGRFGSQRIYRGEPGAYHSGLDIATGESGTSFVAPADGVVILAADEPFTLEGHLLMIDHGMGLNSAFLHCSQLLVKEGDVVRQGQVIGRIGMTGRATGPHLHWSIKWRDRRLDPLLFTGPVH